VRRARTRWEEDNISSFNVAAAAAALAFILLMAGIIVLLTLA
jgi:hypothetical protein